MLRDSNGIVIGAVNMVVIIIVVTRFAFVVSVRFARWRRVRRRLQSSDSVECEYRLPLVVGRPSGRLGGDGHAAERHVDPGEGGPVRPSLLVDAVVFGHVTVDTSIVAPGDQGEK